MEIPGVVSSVAKGCNTVPDRLCMNGMKKSIMMTSMERRNDRSGRECVRVLRILPSVWQGLYAILIPSYGSGRSVIALLRNVASLNAWNSCFSMTDVVSIVSVFFGSPLFSSSD